MVENRVPLGKMERKKQKIVLLPPDVAVIGKPSADARLFIVSPIPHCFSSCGLSYRVKLKLIRNYYETFKVRLVYTAQRVHDSRLDPEKHASHRISAMTQDT